MGCSVLIDVEGPQCDVDADCVALGVGDRCERNVCVGALPACTGDACEPEDPTNESCEQDTDCGGLAPICMHGSCVPSTVAERFMCAGQQSEEPPATVTYEFNVIEFITREAPGNLVVRACRNADVECKDAVDRFEDTEGTGHVVLTLPYGFMGYFDVASDAVHGLSYRNQPIRESIVDRDLQLPSASTLTALASVAGYEYESDKGVVLIEAFDCSMSPAGGIHFLESRGDAHSFYFDNHLPNSSLQETVYDAENDVADGGFLNIAPGYIEFTAQFGQDGAKLGAFTASVRPETVTYIDMFF